MMCASMTMSAMNRLRRWRRGMAQSLRGIWIRAVKSGSEEDRIEIFSPSEILIHRGLG